MAELNLISSKISDELIQKLDEHCTSTKLKRSAVIREALEKYLGLSQVDKVDGVDELRLEMNTVKDRLAVLEQLTIVDQSSTPPIKPIAAAVTIGSPTIITESLVQPELQPSNEVENNPIMTRAKDETQSQPEFQPIGIDQDANTNAAPSSTSKPIEPTLLTVLELKQALGDRYGKSKQWLGKIVNKAFNDGVELPPNLVKLGVRMNRDARQSGNPFDSRLQWLWIETPNHHS